VDNVLTIGFHDRCDVGVVPTLASQQGHSRRAALGHGTEVFAVEPALFPELILNGRLIAERVHHQVLVISHDQYEVGSAAIVSASDSELSREHESPEACE
jgi:hypothetical protein